MVSAYPSRDRTAWILAQRPPRRSEPETNRAHGIFVETEPLASGAVVPSGVVLLTNKECPLRCLMCDLWKNTSTRTVPVGAIPRQIEQACKTWSDAGITPRQLKLYNSGSFFDPAAIPVEDYAPIAEQVRFAENVVVESHPSLIGRRALQFRDLRNGPLEVAMGLETAHPEILEKLNKQFDLRRFESAAHLLRAEGIALRVFLLVNPPFLHESEALGWVVKSAEFAFTCGATAVSLIPTRTGNGAMEQLLAAGEFIPPTLNTLETALRETLALRGGRVFVDTWGLEPFSHCPSCFATRRARLQRINLTQRDEPLVVCGTCEGR